MRPFFSFVHQSYIVLLSLVLLAACQPTKPRVLFGHQDDVVYGSDWQRLADSAYTDTRSCIYDVTGQWPDLIGFDIGGIELCHARNLDSVPFSRMIEECARQFERGGKVTLSWHARNPLTGGNSWDTTPCLAQIVDSSTAVHDTMQVWIERAAAFVAQVAALQTQPEQLIVRLWHEQSGNWFWWGREAGSADDYIALWQWTRNDMNLRIHKSSNFQILYAYSPDKLTRYEDTPEGAYRETAEWYPGDEYVDIIGTDCYHHGGAEGTEDYLYRAHRQLDAAARMAKEHGKRFAFTETGCEALRCPHWYTTVLLPLLREYPDIEYVLVWRNAWDIPSHYFLPLPGTPEAEDFKIFMNQLRIVHRTSVNRK